MKTTQTARKSALRPKTSVTPLAAVEAQLESYAERGVFRSFSRTSLRNGVAGYRFFWLLNLPFAMSFDTKRGAILFKKLLPHFEAGSTVETELKTFIEDCASSKRPEHRRIDPKQIRISYANRANSVTLTLQVLDGDWENGVRKAIHLVNEIFLNFLNARHPEYMIATFNLPDE